MSLTTSNFRVPDVTLQHGVDRAAAARAFQRHSNVTLTKGAPAFAQHDVIVWLPRHRGDTSLEAAHVIVTDQILARVKDTD